MYLERIILHDFKNIPDATVDFSPRINCISGANGTGKTNLLDAVYYLSMTKSYFSASDQFVLRHGCEEAVMTGFYRMDDGLSEKISAAVRKGSKTLLRGAKAYSRISDHIGLLPVVMIAPSDGALINDTGEERRKYLNAMISQVDREYLRHIQAYNKLLLNRNRILKDAGSDLLLDTVTEQMAPHAAYVHEAREQFCKDLSPIAERFYRRISSSDESVSLSYRSNMAEHSFVEIMDANREKDRALGFTLGGPQRDELHLQLDGYPLRKCGSQGQQKTFLIALKLAQHEFMRERYRLSPILLLDDVFDKLDMQRVENLVSLVAEDGFGQIFLTDSNKVRLDTVVGRFHQESAHFFVENGQYNRI